MGNFNMISRYEIILFRRLFDWDAQSYDMCFMTHWMKTLIIANFNVLYSVEKVI